MLFNNIKKLLFVLIAFHAFFLLFIFFQINNDWRSSKNINNNYLKSLNHSTNLKIFCLIKTQTKNIHTRLVNSYDNYIKYCDDYR